MKKELRDKWCAALRSGKYKQGEGALKERDWNGKITFCCLGVLRELAPGLARKHRNGEKLSSPSLKRVGMSKDQHKEAIARNDGRQQDSIDSIWNYRFKKRQTFKQIANWIEANL